MALPSSSISPIIPLREFVCRIAVAITLGCVNVRKWQVRANVSRHNAWLGKKHAANSLTLFECKALLNILKAASASLLTSSLSIEFTIPGGMRGRGRQSSLRRSAFGGYSSCNDACIGPTIIEG